jgi:DNA-binding GntR family transcriptional regulator
MGAIPVELSDEPTVRTPSHTSRARILDMVRDAKGVLRTGQRALADALDISPTRVGQLIRELAREGAIRVRSSKTGSVITLAQSTAH